MQPPGDFEAGAPCFSFQSVAVAVHTGSSIRVHLADEHVHVAVGPLARNNATLVETLAPSKAHRHSKTTVQVSTGLALYAYQIDGYGGYYYRYMPVVAAGSIGSKVPRVRIQVLWPRGVRFTPHFHDLKLRV